MEGDYASFDEDAFKKEMADALGVSDITIINAYSGSIIVVYEVSKDEISLEELVNKFASGDVVLTYPIIYVSSSTSDEDIKIVKDGKVTNAAKMRFDTYERDMKASLIIVILGIAVVLMFCFGIFICLRQRAMFNDYVSKHVPLTTPDSARTDNTDKDNEK